MTAGPAARLAERANALLAIPLRDRPIAPFDRDRLDRDAALALQDGVLTQIVAGRGLVATNPIHGSLAALYVVLNALELRVVHWLNWDLGDEFIHRALVQWADDGAGAFSVFALVPDPSPGVPAWARPPRRS